MLEKTLFKQLKTNKINTFTKVLYFTNNNCFKIKVKLI